MHLLLLSDTPTVQNRRFSGIANSGKPFTYQGRRAVIDMASLTLADKVPALLLHDRNQRVGFGKLSIKDHALLIDGQLLNNTNAQSIISDAKAGFPWQMSAHVDAPDSYELAENESATVNGQTITHPCTILKNATVREVSFTPTGVDSHTSAVILSDDGYYLNKNPKQEQPMSDSKNPTDQTNLANQALADENASLKAIISDLKVQINALTAKHKRATVAAKLSAKGFVPNDDSNGIGFNGLSASTVALLLSADDDKLDDIINDLPNSKAQNAGFLLSEQYGINNGVNGSANDGNGNPLLADAKARK